MPKKKKRGKKEPVNQGPIFQPIVFITNKVGTMIEMLDSPEPKLLLRIIGTLSKAVAEKESNVEYMLSCGLYYKLQALLKSPDIYTLRFTLFLIQKVLGNLNFLRTIAPSELSTTADLVKKLYLSSSDKLIRTLSVNILLHLAKHHSMLSEQIYCVEVLEKIFEVLKAENNLEFAEDNLELLFYVMNSVRAENELLKCSGFSIASFLCFFETAHESLKELAVSILHKMAMWKRSEVLLALGNAKVIEAMTRLLFLEPPLHYEKAFDTMYTCLSEDVCACNFVKSLEFVKLLEWMKMCPKEFVGHSSLVLRSLSEKEALLQVLFDFSAEQAAISLFRFLNEPVILNICDVICNMMRHRYCCEKMAKPSLMKILVEITNADDKFPMVPYGEKALKTLHTFFRCYLKTPQIVYESKTIMTLIDIFCKAKERMTTEGYVQIIEIMQYLAKSEYSKTLRNIGMYQLLIDLYRDSTFEEDKLLNIMESFLDCDEFREVYLDRAVLGMMMEKIKSHKDPDCVVHTLMVLKKLIVYKKIGVCLIDQGYLAELRHFKQNFTLGTRVIDQIINALYDFCLTVKFFYEKKLYENDKIRDDFILIPDAITSMPLDAFNVKAASLSTYIPIYVVNFLDLIYDVTDPKGYLLDEDPVSMSSTRRLAQRKSELSPYHWLTLASLEIRKSAQVLQNVSYEGLLCEDWFLTSAIREIYDEFYERNPSYYTKRQYRISHIAKCIDTRMSGNQADKQYWAKHIDKQHAFTYHLRTLIKQCNSNFIPIGHLKIGFQCERALLFKVICDQTRVSTTLCKEGDSYFNEVSLISSSSSIGSGKLIQRTFIVDLMEHVGELMPADSVAAKMYLQRNKSEF